jgi:hypothetical protein
MADETAAAEEPKLSEEEFAAQQRLEAEAQGGGAVPERRPQASTVVDPGPDNWIAKQLAEAKEEGELPDDSAMGPEAYERAASDKQAKAAAKDSQTDSLLEGTRVKIIDGPHAGRVGPIIRREFDSFEEQLKAASGVPAVARFAKVSSVTIRTRDARQDLVTVTPDQVEPISAPDYAVFST